MKRNDLLRTLIGIGIAGLFVYLAFRGISFDSLFHDAARANFLILVAATLIAMFSLFLRSVRWKIILQELKPEISTVNTWGSLMVGYMLNNFVPRLGEIVRAYTTAKIEDTKVSAVLGTILIERLIDMVTAGVLFGIALASFGSSIIKVYPFLRLAGLIFIVASIALSAIFYIVAVVKSANRILMKFIAAMIPHRLVEKTSGFINSFLSAFTILRSPRRITYITLYTVLIWFTYILQIYVPFFAFTSTSKLDVYDAFILGMMATIAWLIPSPGALGVYHLFVSQTLARFFGVVPDEALAYATLTHLFGYIGITVLGAIFAFIFTRKLRIKSIGKLLETEETIGKF